MPSVKKSKHVIILTLITWTFLFMTPFTYAAVTTATLHYTDVGKGPALVLIHAFPTDSRLWDLQQNALANHFRLINVDLIGFGQSPTTTGQAVSMADQAEAIKQVLDSLQIKRAILAGESMGGYVALAFLQHYPEQTSGLILSGSQAIADNEETKTKREALANDILKNGASKLITDFVNNALSEDVPSSTRETLTKIVSSQTVTGMASALRGMSVREDTRSVLSGTNIPVLIIAGEKDKVINPDQSKIMHSLAKNSHLVILPGAGHLSNLEQPKAWSDEVIAMFAFE